jgi:hypothetical protein
VKSIAGPSFEPVTMAVFGEIRKLLRESSQRAGGAVCNRPGARRAPTSKTERAGGRLAVGGRCVIGVGLART